MTLRILALTLAVALIAAITACDNMDPPTAPTPVVAPGDRPITLAQSCAINSGQLAGETCVLPPVATPDRRWSMRLRVVGFGFPYRTLLYADIEPINAHVSCDARGSTGGGAPVASGNRSWTFEGTPSKGDSLTVICYGQGEYTGAVEDTFYYN